MAGSQISQLAIPFLAIVLLGASAFEVGLLQPRAASHVVGAVGLLLTAIPVFFSPVRSPREMPPPVEDD